MISSEVFASIHTHIQRYCSVHNCDRCQAPSMSGKCVVQEFIANIDFFKEICSLPSPLTYLKSKLPNVCDSIIKVCPKSLLGEEFDTHTCGICDCPDGVACQTSDMVRKLQCWDGIKVPNAFSKSSKPEVSEDKSLPEPVKQSEPVKDDKDIKSDPAPVPSVSGKHLVPSKSGWYKPFRPGRRFAHYYVNGKSLCGYVPEEEVSPWSKSTSLCERCNTIHTKISKIKISRVEEDSSSVPDEKEDPAPAPTISLKDAAKHTVDFEYPVPEDSVYSVAVDKALTQYHRPLTAMFASLSAEQKRHIDTLSLTFYDYHRNVRVVLSRDKSSFIIRKLTVEDGGNPPYHAPLGYFGIHSIVKKLMSKSMAQNLLNETLA